MSEATKALIAAAMLPLFGAAVTETAWMHSPDYRTFIQFSMRCTGAPPPPHPYPLPRALHIDINTGFGLGAALCAKGMFYKA